MARSTLHPIHVSLVLSIAACSVAYGCGGNDVLATRDASDSGTGGGGTGGSAGVGGTGAIDAGQLPVCEPTATGPETSCTDNVDNDCDGFADCLDTDCDGQSCGAGELTCIAGGCLQPSDGLPELPRIDNVRVTQRGDTAIVDFEPVEGARDYRIYPLPSSDDVLIGENGELVVQNAIYRCAGDRPLRSRSDDPATAYDASLGGGANLLHDYERDEADSVLGHVYLTPGEGREAVYRMADPNGHGGFQNADWLAPMLSEQAAADYVIGTAARQEALNSGMRDDGIVFYAPAAGTVGTTPVYRKQYSDQWNGPLLTFYFTEGDEYDARAMDSGDDVVDFGERFEVFVEPQAGTVPLHRVLYSGNNSFDVLAAGEPRFQWTLNQGNQPIWSLAWPGLTATTTLVIEALDQGCPFPDGYVASHSAPADEFNYPSLTLDEARLDSGEVYINGQHDPANRPRPIARAYVEVTPEADPDMDWFEGFDADATWDPFEIESGNNGVFIYRNDKWAIDFSGCTPNLTVGPMLGQLVVGYADGGSSCNMSMVPREIEPQISANDFLHVRMSTTIPSTGRRYPQVMITTTDVLNPGDVQPLDSVPLHARLGPFSFSGEPVGSGPERSIIVQPFGGYHELNLEFCDGRGWGVSEQCPHANIYGHHAGNYTEEWEEPWLPLPPLGDVAGFDRPVQLDVYASTERVYVFVDDKPAGCGILPTGRMPEGDVNVAFRGVLYHCGIDESVVPDDSAHQYLKRFSLCHFDRAMDDFGIDEHVPAPAWNEDIMPCGTRWY